MELSHLRSRRLESGIVGISMQNRKSIKINIKIKRQKEGVNSVVLLGKEEEEKKKERKK